MYRECSRASLVVVPSRLAVSWGARRKTARGKIYKSSAGGTKFLQSKLHCWDNKLDLHEGYLGNYFDNGPGGIPIHLIFFSSGKNVFPSKD